MIWEGGCKHFAPYVMDLVLMGSWQLFIKGHRSQNLNTAGGPPKAVGGGGGVKKFNGHFKGRIQK